MAIMALVFGLAGSMLWSAVRAPAALAGTPYECNGAGGPPGIHCGCDFSEGCDPEKEFLALAAHDGFSRTASLDVYHETTESSPVQPVLGETWTITATWRAEDASDNPQSPCPCDDRVEVVTADVYWDAASAEYKVNCTGCNATYSQYNGAGSTFIYRVDVCTTYDCEPDRSQSSKYELIVDLQEQVDHCGEGVNVFPLGGDGTDHFLHAVEFSTTTVDEGQEMDEACNLGDVVVPTTQHWYAVDLGRDDPASAFEFECDFDCSAVGPDLTILYE